MVTKASDPGLFLEGVAVSGSADLRGLSTDSKPTNNIPNGSTFIEMDSGKVYMWDAGNGQWRLM